VVTTVLECANGQTVIVNHDCSSPRPKSSMMKVQGIAGLWNSENDSVHVEDRSPAHEWEPFEEFREEFEHPLWEEYLESGIQQGSHGGNDYLTLRGFVQSVAQGVRPPVDVYDAAAWRAITPLSEQSVELGSEPVAFPDFTDGDWMVDEPVYGLAGDVPEGRLDSTSIL